MIESMAWFGMFAFALGMCYSKGRKRGRDEMFHYLRKINAVNVDVIRRQS